MRPSSKAGTTRSHWLHRRCRFEDGIFFGDDTFIELCGAPGAGYRADLRSPIATLLGSHPQGWVEVEEFCSASAGDVSVFAGAAGSDAGGFVAVEQRSAGGLLWILHLRESEAFVQLGFDGEVIRAVSGEHRFRATWEIPVDAPEDFTVSQTRNRES